jgi:large subunit ribosomal protein L9
MELILMEDVPAVGKLGDVVKVSDGYARNYLLPRKKAVPATAKTQKALEHTQRLVQRKQEQSQTDAQALMQRLAEISCTVRKPAGEEGKLFGAVTSADIAQALHAQGVDVDRRKIVLDEPIKHLGTYTVAVKLHATVVAPLNVTVEKE